MRRSLNAELLDLSPAERLGLIGELWDSLDADDLPPLSEKVLDELDHDFCAHEANPSSSKPWEEVEEWLQSRRK